VRPCNRRLCQLPVQHRNMCREVRLRLGVYVHPAYIVQLQFNSRLYAAKSLSTLCVRRMSRFESHVSNSCKQAKFQVFRCHA
jgi:hypothetical protein